MRVETITMNVYEVGDIITLDKNFFHLVAKQQSASSATKALVVSRLKLQTGGYSYKVVANNGKMYTMKPDEMGKEKYIGHIDLSQVFETA